MGPKEFVHNFYLQKEDLLATYIDPNEETSVGELIKSMQLNQEQFQILKQVLDNCLTDGFYAILLGLDGAASIGNEQHDYKILNENGAEISGGDIESFAWEFFQKE